MGVGTINLIARLHDDGQLFADFGIVGRPQPTLNRLIDQVLSAHNAPRESDFVHGELASCST